MKVMVYYGKHDIRFEERIELKKTPSGKSFSVLWKHRFPAYRSADDRFYSVPDPGPNFGGHP
ncbi:hypothetical protein GQ155_004406 [Salmonella enterica]|nr:hypothetical protein [Salmonella enterica]EAM8742298.1 hypothetical protein [Salmonella enterica]EAZ9079706.1 hypothetical protein [Salmonella enterica]EDT0101111.1 hypothetical protein [Salmonella enterica]